MKVYTDVTFICINEGVSKNGEHFANGIFIADENRTISFKSKTEEVTKKLRDLQLGDMVTVHLNFYDFRDGSGKQVYGFTLVDVVPIK